MSVMEADHTAAKPIGIEGAEITDDDDGSGGQQQEASSGEDHRATEAEPRVTVVVGAVGPSSEPVHSSMAVENQTAVGGSSDNVGGSGTVGDDDDIGPSGSPPRDPAKGKGIAPEEEQAEKEQTTKAATVEIREENIAFKPPVTAATSSRHVSITLEDVAEHATDEILAKLLEDNPVIGEYVWKAKEDRARAIEAFEAAVRAERERAGPGGLAADVEAEEREAEEAQGPRVSAVTKAATMMRPEFLEETYTLPRPHLFVLSGFAGYRPQQTDYDVELVLRDPRVHIVNIWAEVHFLPNPLCALF
ncbi:hypothetical protein RHMOL_Rhmol06G0124700 [Rhododendron molle]|uniref:Uncharacterized protein n=1 Tax=Rhododendron molle TaxID=49168 RepID=A0ACC0NBT9_RHOML|nr:hypothetical protein RHMOL_Rhmol06G0124700 [Rhododendron molle]